MTMWKHISCPVRRKVFLGCSANEQQWLFSHKQSSRHHHYLHTLTPFKHNGHSTSNVITLPYHPSLFPIQSPYSAIPIRKYPRCVTLSTRTFANFPRSNNVSSDGTIATKDSLLDIREPQKGSGFDNFIPKEGHDSNASESADGSKKSDSSSSKKGTGGEGDSGNGNKNNSNNNNPYTGWATLAVLFVVAYFVDRANGRESQQDTDTDSSSGQRQQQQHREITWHDFLRLLQQQDVMKVVVTDTQQQNNAQAKVYLKPNATGLARTHSAKLSNGSEHHNSMNNQFYEQSGTHLDGLEHTSALSSHSNASFDLASKSEPPFYYRLPIGTIDAFEKKLDEAERRLGRSQQYDVPVQYLSDNRLMREIAGILPGLLMAAVLFALMRYGSSATSIGGGGGGGGGGIFSIGKSTAKKIKKEDIKVTFKDVAGCDEAKKEVMEFVDFLKDSDRFTKLGAKIPKGALLCGPPGTGKTLLAKAVAGEAGVPFYSISGSDFIEMFVGVGPSRVRDLFSEARENAPCIIFIDEIDAVGRTRGRGGMGGNDERENTLNQLLVEMDGFSPSTGVVVLAGTNRADILDQALTRPGRFDRQIVVDKPDLKGRKEIFKVHLTGIKLENEAEDVAGRLAGLTPGFAGADISNICNEAAIVAARRKGETVTMADFEKATDRIIGGLESNKIMSKDERNIVAHHEAGHAVAGWFLEHADPLLKVTIIPRSSGALGFAQYLPKEVFLRTQDQIMDIVCMALAGRAAEEIFFGQVTTGASDDLKRVTQLVYSTIQLYGMNTRLGQLSFPKDPNAMFEDRPYSEKTAKAMDEEAKSIVDVAYKRTLDLLTSKKEQLQAVAKLLLDKETITHDDMIDLIGKRPFKGDPAYEEFIHRKREILSKKRDAEKDKEESVPPPTELTPGLA